MTSAVVEVRRQNVETQINRFCKQHGGEGFVTYDVKLGVILVHYHCTLNDDKLQFLIPVTLSEASKVTVYTTIVRRIAGQFYETIRQEEI